MQNLWLNFFDFDKKAFTRDLKRGFIFSFTIDDNYSQNGNRQEFIEISIEISGNIFWYIKDFPVQVHKEMKEYGSP